MKNRISSAFFYFVNFLSLLLLFSSIWAQKTFGLLKMDALIFHLSVPLKGTESGMIAKYIFDPLLKTIIITIIIAIFALIIKKIKYRYYLSIKIFNFIKNDIDVTSFLQKHKMIISVAFLLIVFVNVIDRFDIVKYINNYFSESKFVEDHYVDPQNANISFNSKNNLIHIYVESLEYTFASKESGGAFEESLIPHLEKYAKNNISFTNDFGGGFYNSRGTQWTIAGMLAQTAGIGFFEPFVGNTLGQYSRFMPGVYSLGEILDNMNYNQVLLIGSDGDFAGRNDYFKQHGNYIIKDYNYAKKEGWIEDDYYVWWGYEDSKLFEFAKKELNELSKKNKPFNLTILTTNMHHIGGYLEDSCEKKYDDQFKNVILCSDKQIFDFVEWIKKQAFYKDTTIVITGDHLSMDPEFFDKNIDESYVRTNYNLFINSAKKATNTINRIFNTMDIYPTIVSSLGGNINDNRLGLGTDLFSKKKTLYEELSKSFVDEELSKSSNYFNKKLLRGN